MKETKCRKNCVGRGEASGVGRRDVMKLGVGAGVAAMTQMLHAPEALARDASAAAAAPSAQAATDQAARKFVPPPAASGASKGVPGGSPYTSGHTWKRRISRYGEFKNTSGRAFGNGPMDATTQRIVDFAVAWKQPGVTDTTMAAIGDMFMDSLGCAISSLDTDSILGVTRLTKRIYPPGEMKSTIWGYGIPTNPEQAAFVSSCMIRHHDNNSAGMHETDQIGGILAIGEALHSSGPEVLSALILFWEVFAALLTAQPIGDAPGNRGVWSSIDNWAHAPATAVAVGKLLGLNGDQMGNAIALSFVNHIALMVDHWNGPNSMTKSNHDAVLCRAGVFAALQAREGITGPAEPFEGEKALWDVLTGPFDLKIPARVSLQPTRPLPPGDNRYAIETLGYKRVPGDSTGTGVAQVILRNYQEYKDFAKPEDITAIEFEVNQWGDGDDPGKFDPLNSETADHSPYPACRALLDGELWEGSYALDKLTEPAVRQLMSKVSIQENPDKKGSRFTVRSKSGASVTKETGGEGERMTHADLQKKYERICVYKGLTKEQMDKIRTTWADLRNVKDIAVPIRDTLAHYGRPKLI